MTVAVPARPGAPASLPAPSANGRAHRSRPPRLPAALPVLLLALLATVAVAPRLGPPPGPGLPPVIVHGRDRTEMVLVPAGPFVMGSWLGDSDEAPVSVVDLPAFYIDRHEVTNARFAGFLNALPWNRRRRVHEYLTQGPTSEIVLGSDDRYQVVAGMEDHPVRHVSWHGAMAYARWAGKDLPTEAQWEKAARGANGRLYPWGSVWNPRRASTYGAPDGFAMVAPVGSFPSGASPYGALDMAGNMWEWTRSLYRPYPYAEDDGRNDPEAPGPRVIRGGSYIYNSPRWTVRGSDRYSDQPTYADDDYGLRCVVPAPP